MRRAAPTSSPPTPVTNSSPILVIMLLRQRNRLFSTFFCTVSCIVVLLLTSQIASAQSFFASPSEFGKANITLTESVYRPESVVGRVASFQPVNSFAPNHLYRQIAQAVGRLDLLLQQQNGRINHSL